MDPPAAMQKWSACATQPAVVWCECSHDSARTARRQPSGNTPLGVHAPVPWRLATAGVAPPHIGARYTPWSVVAASTYDTHPTEPAAVKSGAGPLVRFRSAGAHA